MPQFRPDIFPAIRSFKDNIDRDTSYFTTDYLPVHPFESGRDIVDRLLPFHLWQIHDQDLDCRPKDAKRRMTGESGANIFG